MSRLFLLPLLASALAVLGAGPVSKGTLPLPQVSACAALPDRSLILVSDGPTRLARLERLPSPAAESRELLTFLPAEIRADDLEAAAADGTGSVFLIASHSRTPRGDAPESRYRLVRMRLDAAGRPLKLEESDALVRAIQEELPFLADAMRRPPARAGLNIEGLAWAPEGDLLVGLRAPTITESAPREHGGQEDAVVLRIRSPHAIFDASSPAELGDTVKLDLRGQGIRGMEYDPERKAYWLLSGLSVEPNYEVRTPWALWLWDGVTAPRLVRLPEGVDLQSPEAVCRVESEGEPHLLLIEPRRDSSRYVLLPLSGLK